MCLGPLLLSMDLMGYSSCHNFVPAMLDMFWLSHTAYTYSTRSTCDTFTRLKIFKDKLLHDPCSLEIQTMTSVKRSMLSIRHNCIICEVRTWHLTRQDLIGTRLYLPSFLLQIRKASPWIGATFRVWWEQAVDRDAAEGAVNVSGKWHSIVWYFQKSWQQRNGVSLLMLVSYIWMASRII